tara:strand:+ start:368 stop:610 length:243 start_codon:yes stop_codon:yes gene_type:complete
MRGFIKDGKLFIMEKDGHTDVASSKRKCENIIRKCQMILDNLPDEETSLPTWWTDKIAIAEYEIASGADYLAGGLSEEKE